MFNVKNDKVKKIKTKLRVKDIVVKICGKDKGKSGEIITIDYKTSMALVKGLCLRTKWQRPTQENPQGGTLDVEQSIHISNLMIYDAKEKKGTRLKAGFSEDKKNNVKKVRIAKTSGKEV